MKSNRRQFMKMVGVAAIGVPFLGGIQAEPNLNKADIDRIAKTLRSHVWRNQYITARFKGTGNNIFTCKLYAYTSAGRGEEIKRFSVIDNGRSRYIDIDNECFV